MESRDEDVKEFGFEELRAQLKSEETPPLTISDKGQRCEILSAHEVQTKYGLRRVAVLKLSDGSKRKRWLSLSDEANIRTATKNSFVVELEQGSKNRIYLVLRPVSSNPPTANQSAEAFAND